MISILGCHESYFKRIGDDIDMDPNELPFEMYHINADYITEIYNKVIESHYIYVSPTTGGPKEGYQEKEYRCIMRKGELPTIYTEETFENLFKLINSWLKVDFQAYYFKETIIFCGF